MRDADCVELLQWAAPRMGLRWAGFQRVKRQVLRRVRARIHGLGLGDARAYAEYLEREPSEWAELEARCGITISRFYRDREVFDCITGHVLPTLTGALPAGEPLRVWSAGCASGEEPYTIALIWQLQLSSSFPGHALRLLATDRDARLLARAADGCYRHSSLRELPRTWVELGFTRNGEAWCIAPELRRSVVFERQDLRRENPLGQFDLILCRNLAFSYFETCEQRRILRGFIDRLRPNGYLVIGLHEQLPEAAGLVQLPQSSLIYHRARPSCARVCG